jgi:uncharacterized membrane protein (DUF2068 family)
MHKRYGLRVVSLFEATKGLLVLVVGCGLLALVHENLHKVAEELVRHFHLNPASGYPRIFLDAVDQLDDSRLWLMALCAFAYSVVRFVEAFGLWLRKRWAEWFGLLSGGLYVPVELFEITRGASWPKVAVLVVNAGIVTYLAYTLSHHSETRREPVEISR